MENLDLDNEEVTVAPAEEKARKNGWLPEADWHASGEDCNRTNV